MSVQYTISLGIGTPAGIPEFLLLGLQVPVPIVDFQTVANTKWQLSTRTTNWGMISRDTTWVITR